MNELLVHMIVVNYRTPELAVRCAATAMQRLDVATYIEIADTSDGPGAVTGAPAHIPTRYFANIGYGGAVNEALNRPLEGCLVPRAPFLLVCNADTELPPDGIGALLELMAAEQDIGLLGPRQVSPGGTIVHGGITEFGSPAGGRGWGERDEGQFRERVLDMPQISGSVMLMRRDAFDVCGGMPPVRLYYEDALLCHEMRRMGYRVVYSGLRTFLHHVAASPQPAGSHRAVLASESRAYFEEVTR